MRWIIKIQIGVREIQLVAAQQTLEYLQVDLAALLIQIENVTIRRVDCRISYVSGCDFNRGGKGRAQILADAEKYGGAVAEAGHDIAVAVCAKGAPLRRLVVSALQIRYRFVLDIHSDHIRTRSGYKQVLAFAACR
ncbi:hypothetical protein D3C75_275740 [compost metagenome]